ncbi:mCG1048803, partial [Mus musculus]
DLGLLIASSRQQGSQVCLTCDPQLRLCRAKDEAKGSADARQASLKSICPTVASPSCCLEASGGGERINYPTSAAAACAPATPMKLRLMWT